MTSVGRAAARGAFAVPFFVLPALLTVDAPDIHGGHAVHVQQGVALAAIGAALGALQGGAAERIAPRARALWVAAAAVVAGVALAGFATRVAVRAANRLAALGGRLPEDAGGLGDAYGPGYVVMGLIALVGATEALRVLRGGAPMPTTVAVAAAWAVVAARLASMVGGDTSAAVAWGLQCAVLGLLLLPRRVTAAPLEPARGRPTAVAGGALVLVAVAPPLPLALLAGAVLFVAVGRSSLPGRAAATLRGAWERAPREWKTPGFAVAVVAMLPAVGVALQLAPAVGAAVASIAPGAHAQSYRALPDPARIPGFLFAVVAVAELARGRPRRPVLGAAAWLAAGYVLAAVVGAGGGTSAGDLFAAVPALAALAGAVAILRGRGAKLDVAPGAGAVVLGALVGAACARIAGASVIPAVLPVAPLLAGGAVVGGIGSRVAFRRLCEASARPSAGTFAVWALAAFLPMYGAVAYGLHRPWVLGVLAVAAAVWVVTRVRLRWVVFATFYATFAIVTAFKAGPTAESCAQVAERGGATLVLPRFGGEVERLAQEPYDVLPVPGSSRVLVSFKRYQGEGGYLALVDVDARAEVARLRPGDHRDPAAPATWPERLVWDASRGVAWVQVLAEDGYSMWEVRPGRVEPTLTLDRRTLLRWEPGNPDIDVARDSLVVSFVPNRRSNNPLVGSYDLVSGGQRVGRVPPPQAGIFEMADYVSVDAWSGLYYTPAFFDLARFAVVESDPEDGSVRRRAETFHPSVGIAAHGERSRLYLTNSSASTLEVRTTERLDLVQRLPTGAFPRDVAFDRERDRLYVAGYGDGVVTTFDVSGAEVRAVGEVRLGPLLRGLGVDPTTGRVFGASGCGVFEVPTGG